MYLWFLGLLLLFLFDFCFSLWLLWLRVLLFFFFFSFVLILLNLLCSSSLIDKFINSSLFFLFSLIFIPQLAQHLFDIGISLHLYIMLNEFFPLFLFIFPASLHLPLLFDLKLLISIVILLLILRTKMKILQFRTISESLSIPIIENLIYSIAIQFC